MKKQYLFLYFLVFLFTNSNATNPSVLFKQANKTYRSGDYAKAIELYEQILKSSYSSPSVYFNLGNAYYKQDDFAHAILNYERAKKMNSQDDDVLFNLKMANLNTVDKIEPVPQLFYEIWWQNFINSFETDKWAKISIVCLWLTFILAILYVFAGSITFRKIWFVSAFFGISGFLMLLFITYSSSTQINSNKAAIIINASAYVKSSPDEKSTNLFMLHAGTRIEILDQLQNWKKIKIANGNVGWILKEDVEII